VEQTIYHSRDVKMAIRQSVIAQIQQEYDNAPRGCKTVVVKKWARLLKCSPKRIWAVLETGRKRQRDEDKTELLREITKTVFGIKHRVPDCTSPLSTDQAYNFALKNGLLPKDAPMYSVSSINKMGNRMELNKRSRRIQRFQAEQPNQMHHIDASSSQFFYVDDVLPDGDYILKLHKSSKYYKNKPIPKQVRPWIYGLVDDYSGCGVARYTAAPGESLADNLEFLEWAWGNTDDKPFHGLPKKIKADKGPMMRGKSVEDLLERLSVDVDPSVPGAKDAHGKIERPWRTLWQRFEKQFLVVDDWENFEIKLSELNRQLLIYFNQEYNQRQHRYEAEITREQAWRKISLLGGVRPLPEGAICTTFEKQRRKVNNDGTFKLDNKTYEVKGLHDAWVNVFINIFNDEMLVENIETGKKYEVKDFKPNPVDTFTAHKDTPFQKNQKAGADLPINKTLFEEEPQATNIISLPTRVQQEQQFDSVFNSDAYSSLPAAMEDFMSLTGIFPIAESEDRKYLEQKIIEKKLSKSFVQKTAAEFIEYNRRCENG